MRRIAFIVAALLILSAASSYAFESKLLSVYNQFFEESKNIKALLSGTQDILMMNSLWDSCVITMTQLEGYFFMLSIFNTINEGQPQEPSLNYLSDWLNKIKKTDDLSIKSLDSFQPPADQNTQLHMSTLKVYYKKLNGEIDKEIENLSILKKSLKKE